MSIRISVDTSGLINAAARLQSASASFAPVLAKGTQQIADESMRLLIEATPIGIGRTGGHLAESYVLTTYDAFPESGGFEIATTQGRKMSYVRFGTGIYGAFGHPIVPVVKHAMWWPEAERPYRAVRGQRPNDFVLRVMSDILSYAFDELQNVLDQMVTLLERGGSGW